MIRLPALLIAASLVVPAAASAKMLPVKDISSNSVLTDADKGIVYGPENMLDEQVTTMWVEGEGSAGLGKYIQVKFEEEVELAQVRIWAGCFLDEEFFQRHNRVAQLEFKYPDFSSEKFDIEDSMTPQILKLAEPKTLDGFKIYLRRVEDGNTWNATVITKIEFFDKGGLEGPVEGLIATASSTYDNDDAYDAKYAVDGWTDTHWVEGSKAGGNGEYLEIDLGGRKSLKRFEVSTGWAQTDSFFQGYNRAEKVTLSFSDGSSQSFDLDANEKGLQSFDLKPVTSSKVKVTFDKVKKGDGHNELYVGEVRFFE